MKSANQTSTVTQFTFNIFLAEEWIYVSAEAKNLVETMLRVEPSKRPSVSDCLKHPWFTKVLHKHRLNDEQVSKYFNNILTFKIDPKYFFQHATLAFMIHHLTTKEHTEEIRRLFYYMDKKGDGKLTYSEIVDGFKSLMAVNEKDVFKILKHIDQGKTGVIEYEEFIRSCIEKTSLLTEDKLKTTFILFTKDENKNISPAEFKQFLGLQSKFNEKTWEQIIKTIDINGDNQVIFVKIDSI